MTPFMWLLTVVAIVGAQVDGRPCESGAGRSAAAIRGEVTRGNGYLDS